MRLNKYIAISGFCGRRKADDYIRSGLVTINQQVVKTLGTRVSPEDQVHVQGHIITPTHKAYFAFYKPKQVLVTTKDPQGRPTVYDYMKGLVLPPGLVGPRAQALGNLGLFPVGRLDWSTEGLLFFYERW